MMLLLFLLVGSCLLIGYLLGWRGAYYLAATYLVGFQLALIAATTFLTWFILESPWWQVQLFVQALILFKRNIWENAGLGDRVTDFVAEKARQGRLREEQARQAKRVSASRPTPAPPRPRCARCGASLEPSFAFCPTCGAKHRA